jgi:hypothetical protein
MGMKIDLSLVGGIVGISVILAVGCSSQEEAPTATPSVAAITVGPTATVSPSTPIPGSEPAGFEAFREFAPLVIHAVLAADVAFFTDRADRVTIPCRGVDSLEPCSTHTGIAGYAWRSDAGGVFTDEFYALNLRNYRDGSLPDRMDRFGDGRLRLFAIASEESPDRLTFQVITTSITNVYPSTGAQTEPFRESHAFRFHLDGEEWRFDGEIVAAASVTAEDWLSGDCAQCYDYWERWTEE